MSLKADVQEDIAAHEEDMLSFLSDLVGAETVTGHEAPGQDIVEGKFETLGLDEIDRFEPDAADLRDHAGWFPTNAFDQYGFEGRENIVGTLEGAGDGPTLTLGGHIDVVDVEPDEWERDPWTMTVEDDRIYGRGSADMKGGIAAYVAAVKAVQRAGIELEGDLYLQSTIEEEAGGTGGALAVLERGYQPDAAVITEPFNVPNVGIASAGVMYFRVTVYGKSAHAAWGHEGVNAIGKANKIYQALEELDAARKERIDYPPAYAADPDLEGNVTNINVGIIEAGDWPSTLPAEVEMQGRVGWPPGETREEIRDQIETAIQEAAAADDWMSEHPPDVEWFGWAAQPHEVPADAEIVQLSLDNTEAVCGEPGELVGGNASLDERFFQRYYDIPVATVGPWGANLHGADEHTTTASLVETAQAVAGIVLDYCGVAEE